MGSLTATSRALPLAFGGSAVTQQPVGEGGQLGEGGRWSEYQGAWVHHVTGKVDESDSVGTSVRKEAIENTGISKGTLGLWRLGVGSGAV